MNKLKIIDQQCEYNIINEKKVLSTLANPFIANMREAFDDEKNLYLVLEYLPGGDLRYHLNKKKKFTEEESSNTLIFNCIQNSLLLVYSLHLKIYIPMV